MSEYPKSVGIPSPLDNVLHLRYNSLMSKDKQVPTSVRLTLECIRLRNALAKKMGISRTAVLEIAVREMAERRGIADGISTAETRRERGEEEAV